jgi:hypothetical protein
VVEALPIKTGRRVTQLDIYHVESEWHDWAKGKEASRDPDRAFLAFFKTFAKANPT